MKKRCKSTLAYVYDLHSNSYEVFLGIYIPLFLFMFVLKNSFYGNLFLVFVLLKGENGEQRSDLRDIEVTVAQVS